VINKPQVINSPKDLKDPPPAYKQFAPPLDWNPFWFPQPLAYEDLIPLNRTFSSEFTREPF